MYTCASTMLCFKYHPKTLLFCELLALTWWPHIFLYFSLTECQKSCSHPMTPHFLSLCSHRMPQPVGGRALHPYPLHIWLPPPRVENPILSVIQIAIMTIVSYTKPLDDMVSQLFQTWWCYSIHICVLSI